MNTKIYFIIGAIAYFAIIILGLWYLLKSASLLHQELDSLLATVKETESEKELEMLYEDLKDLNKKCWHRSFDAKIIEIKTIIETRHKCLKKEI